MPRMEWNLHVDRSPEDVYAYLADFSKHGEWSPKPFSIEPISGGPTAVGSTFASVGWIPGDKDHANTVEVTAADPGKVLTFVAHDKGGDFTNSFELSTEGSGTQVHRIMDMPPPTGAMKLVMPMARAFIVKPAVQKGLDLLKTNLESAAS
jgi:uncharacterized protein YndB with AHSA1/START domain